MNNYTLTLNAAPDNSNSLKVDLLNVKKASLVLRAINHKLRQQILKLIDENGRITVTEIYVKLRLEQSVASQHLSILRKAGFVNTERDGKFIYYTVNTGRIEELNNFVESLLN
ncbi:MAG: helix-turn-helix transcriptional regulator [Sphingobacteriales bacterium]|jgi:DNA-binding transcriptional ArsR family regulator|nr:helix-turn-helix transcriptional regulator [Sphingobacteriales bacterium]NCT75291.1 helix-turn-helix transcriptional regulator [Chitinophagaceae bacterium]OJW31721.1 MAG: transcriptional regulator [Sphingobacteriales bacterium 46-32]